MANISIKSFQEIEITKLLGNVIRTREIKKFTYYFSKITLSTTQPYLNKTYSCNRKNITREYFALTAPKEKLKQKKTETITKQIKDYLFL